MFVFNTDSRVQNTNKGIRFYEQDVLCSEYSFSGALTVNVRLDYVSPGFGFMMIEERNGTDLANAYQSYLFKLGANDFRFFRKKFDSQQELKTSSCLFAPSPDNKDISLSFVLKDRSVKILQIYSPTKYQELGVCDIPKSFDSYKIGFYSNAGNVIREISFYANVPPNWKTSIHNVLGGRIAFNRDALVFENCEKVAEAEQDHISLLAGTHYLKYGKQLINGSNDIKAYIMYPQEEYTDEELEDDEKNLLQEDGSFELTDDADICLKFKGHNGAVKNICIVDEKNQNFIETEDEYKKVDGSYITIDLKGTTKITWDATVKDLPVWTDYTKKSPYAVVETSSLMGTITYLNITLNRRYDYELNSSTHLLTIKQHDTGKTVFSRIIPITTNDYQQIRIMDNVDADIHHLWIVSDKSSSDAVHQKTVKNMITKDLTSPIIVTDKNNERIFDISASYRRVVIPHKKFILFDGSSSIYIPDDIPVNLAGIHIYGIQAEAKINKNADNIKAYATSYREISSADYTRRGRVFTFTGKIISSKYAHYVVEYTPADQYFYEFTNYERERFDAGSDILKLEKPIADISADITVYAIKKDTLVHEDCFYTVPDANNICSIDYYADEYDIVPSENLIIDKEDNQIKVDGIDISDYREFVVDYLKKESVAINFREEYGEYELDVCSEGKGFLVHYDMHDDGSANDYIHSNIKPDKDKYICLTRKRGE